MKLIKLLLVAAMLLLSSQTFAGEFHVALVEIDFDNQQAQGNLIAARFSENDEERIGCALGNGDGRPYAYCEASLGAGNDAFCITYDAAMIDTIASINTFSFVYFKWEHKVGEDLCRHVTVATRSIHIPSRLKP